MPDFKDMTDAELDKPATRRDFLDVATRRDLQNFVTRSDLQEFATRRDLQEFATRRDLLEMRDELRRHFEMAVEQFRADFGNLFDWTQSTTSTMGKRIDDLDSRVTRLEPRSKP